MAKLGDLVQVMADVTGSPRPSTKEAARRVREAGYIQTGSLGRYGGAEMTATDAANLLLGLLCAASVVEAANAVPLYRGLFGSVTKHRTSRGEAGSDRRISPCPEPLCWLSDTAQGLSLGMALDRLIDMARQDTLQTLFRELACQQIAGCVPDKEDRIDRVINDLNLVSLKLEFRRPRPAVAISFQSYLAVDFNEERTPPEKRAAVNAGDRIDSTTVSHRTIFALGEVLRT